MRLLQVIFHILWGLGYLGNSILFLYIEWSFLQDSFIQIFNPLLHLQVFGVLLTTPLFWIFLVLAVVSHHTLRGIERHLKKIAERTKPIVREVVSPSPQIFEADTKLGSLSSDVETNLINLPAHPQPFPEPISKPEVKPVSKPEVKPVSKPEVKPISKPEVKPVSKPEVKPVSKPEVKPVSKPEVKPEVKPVSKPEVKPEVKPVSKPEVKPISKPENYPIESQVQLLESAIKNSQKVSFTYEKPNGQKIDYTVTPIYFKTVDEALRLVGYCHLRSAEISFVIKCMQNIRIVSASQVKPISQFSSFNASPTNSINTQVEQHLNTQVKQRPYLKYDIHELKGIATLGWNNIKILNEIHYELQFRSRKKSVDLRNRIAFRLNQLQGIQDRWPTTTIARKNDPNSAPPPFKYEEGLLKYYGYRVGINGLSQSERWQILDTVFLYPLSQINSTVYSHDYLSEWGEPKSAKRLKKLADSIATFSRNAKRRNQANMSTAIQDWETDLAYLKSKYYNSNFSFQYPRT